MNTICLRIVVVACGFFACGCSWVQPTGDTQVDGVRSGSAQLVVDGASYNEVFVATREILSGFRFAINRVDASRGVILTYPKRTVGIGSIWDREQSTIGQEWEDFANQQERTIRVGFARADDGAGGGVVVTVEVLVHRVHRPNWRVESESIGLSTHARSMDSVGLVEAREFREPMGHDLAFAQRIASEIRTRFE